MSIEIKDRSCCKKTSEPCWNDMEELKNLICMIDSCKCPSVPPPASRTIILPPRIEEIPCETPLRRPPCVPPPRCCPITSGPCCPQPLPLPILPATLPHFPSPFCHPCSSSPYYLCE